MPEVEMTASGMVVVDAGYSTRVVVNPETLEVQGGTDGADEGYPNVIVTQQDGYGGRTLRSKAEVDAFLEQQIARRFDREPLVSDLEVVPYINASRWVADCPCGSGMLCWDQNPHVFCLECGTRYGVRWQTPALRSAVIRLLAGRALQHRNWDPRRVDGDGMMVETPEFLGRENLLMGIV